MSENTTGYARRFRPKTLEGYVGNTSLVESIMSRLEDGKTWPQSYLLTGTTGCGKTTFARLLVKEYMCENRDPHTGACGECYSCKTIEEYIETGDTTGLDDINEIDITNMSGKADIETILEEMEYPALNGGWKAYILDETHLASSASQNRMLKQIEEPPENVLIIFCTTDPQKMLETLKNRCNVQKSVQKPTLTELSALLATICKTEGFTWDKEGLRLLATKADFVIRNALNYLEQVVNAQDSATGTAVSKEFGTVADATLFEFFRAYLNKDPIGMVKVVFTVKTTVGLENFLDSLVSFTKRGIYILNGLPVEGMSETEIPLYGDLFSEFSMEDLGNLLVKITKMRESRDIETDLLSMCYRQDPSHESDSLPLAPVSESESSVEQKLHATSLRAKSAERVKLGHELLDSASEKVSMSELADLFQIQEETENIAE